MYVKSYVIVSICLVIIVSSVLYSSKRSAIGHNAKQLKVKNLIKSSNQYVQASKESLLKNSIVSAFEQLVKAGSFLTICRVLMSDKDILELYPDFLERIKEIESSILHIKKRFFI